MIGVIFVVAALICAVLALAAQPLGWGLSPTVLLALGLLLLSIGVLVGPRGV